MTTTNQQFLIDSTKLVASARNHVVYVESVVNTADVPDNADKQVESRTLMWATQNEAHAKNDYLKFLAFSAMKGAMQLLQREIDLALSPSWRATRELVWNGVKDALDNPPPNSAMENWKSVYTATRARASNLTFDPAEDNLTLDMSDDNLELVLSTDRCSRFTYQQAQCWLSHRIMLAASPDEANDAVRAFQAEYPDKLLGKLQVYTSRTLQIAKSEGLDALHQKLSVFFKPERARKTRASNKPENMPEDLYDTLSVGGAFEAKRPPAAEGQSAAPTELMQAVADKHKLTILSMDEWKAKGGPRTAPVVVKNFDFRSVNKSELGRAQFLLVGPSAEHDVRVELKNQTVSGSAGDKLPLSVYRLQKMHKQAPYASTIIGVANTTYFSDDALEFAQTLSKTDPKLVFVQDEKVSQALHAQVTKIERLFNIGPAVASGPAQAATEQAVIDVLGLADAPAAPTTTKVFDTMSDDEFGMG